MEEETVSAAFSRKEQTRFRTGREATAFVMVECWDLQTSMLKMPIQGGLLERSV